MGQGTAGKNSEFYVKAQGSKYTKSDVGTGGTDAERVAGAQSVSTPNGRNMLDTGDFSDDGPSNLPGKKTGEWSVEGNYHEDANNGFATLKDAFDNGTQLEAAAVPDDTQASPPGYEMTVYVSELEISSEHDGKVEFSATLVCSDGNGWAPLG